MKERTYKTTPLKSLKHFPLFSAFMKNFLIAVIIVADVIVKHDKT